MYFLCSNFNDDAADMYCHCRLIVTKRSWSLSNMTISFKIMLNAAFRFALYSLACCNVSFLHIEQSCVFWRLFSLLG